MDVRVGVEGGDRGLGTRSVCRQGDPRVRRIDPCYRRGVGTPVNLYTLPVMKSTTVLTLNDGRYSPTPDSVVYRTSHTLLDGLYLHRIGLNVHRWDDFLSCTTKYGDGKRGGKQTLQRGVRRDGPFKDVQETQGRIFTVTERLRRTWVKRVTPINQGPMNMEGTR